MVYRLRFLIIAFLLVFLSSRTVYAQSAPTISSVTSNISSYPSSQIPTYEKFESTFQVTTSATNLQFPYLSSSQAGTYLGRYVDIGISVDGLFLPPGETDWNNAYRQPAFYYQDFLTSSDPNYYLYTNNFSWKVRFSPNKVGAWKYKIEAQDKGGTTQSAETTFTVVGSSSKGFVQVSQDDPRYFEFEDGSLFTGIGLNYKEGNVKQLKNTAELQKLKDNGIEFLRAWISPLNIHGSAWDAWEMMPNHYDGYLPRVPLLVYQNSPGEGVFKWYLSEGDGWYEECAFIGHTQQNPNIKKNTNYYIRAQYRGATITGPRDSAYPNYGLVIKIGGWQDTCRDPYKPGVDPSFSLTTPVTTYGTTNTSADQVVGVWNSGNYDRIPFLYMALENTNAGSKIYIDSIEMVEMTGGTVNNPTLSGPNIIDKPLPEEHMYFAQRQSFEMDKILENVETYDLYIRPVLNEKQEYIFADLLPDGNAQQPDDYGRFYGNGRNEYATRFIQKAWWRYAQARWGYSPNIHSWELLNEGDPADTDHYVLTDELGKFMKCGVFGIPVGTGDAQTCVSNHPNKHMTSTSTWHSFLPVQFWANTNYPNVDFADVHAYINTTNSTVVNLSLPGCSKAEMEKDAAAYQTCHSFGVGGWQIGKPIVRGEAGMDSASAQDENILGIQQDTAGVWFHNYLWASLNHGALHEQYWWNSHINAGTYDHRPHAKMLYDFLQDIPLNKGGYADLAATVSNANLRAYGQKNTNLGRAHFWVQNKNHTWFNVVNGTSIANQSGTVTIGGFAPNTQYLLQEWLTYPSQTPQPQPTPVPVTSSGSGTIVVSVTNLSTDKAYKIRLLNEPATPTPTPTAAPSTPGDVNGDGSVSIVDLSILLSNFGKSGQARIQGDLTGDGVVSINDLSQLLANFGSSS